MERMEPPSGLTRNRLGHRCTSIWSRRALDLEGDSDLRARRGAAVLGEDVQRGHDGMRLLAGVLQTYLLEGNYQYDNLTVADAYGLLR